MLASALNLQLGWGAQWKGVLVDMACIFQVLHLLLETSLGREGRVLHFTFKSAGKDGRTLRMRLVGFTLRSHVSLHGS